MIRELLCWHRYEPVSHYKSFWNKDDDPDLWEWKIIYRCKECKKHKEEAVVRARNIEEFLK